MAQNRRMANIELLRVLAMAMVVILHFLSHSDRLIELDQPITAVRVAGTLLEMACISAVNVYVLISGYFGIESHYKPGKAIELLCRIWFYALLIPVVLLLFGVPVLGTQQGIYGWIQYLFPIETEHYWFATAYMLLYLVSPLLNRAAKGMTQKQYGYTLLGLLILFSGIKSFSPVVFAFDKFGYDLPWFVCVYLVGGYLRKYGLKGWEKKGWRLYLGSSFVCFGINLLLWFLSQRFDAFRYYFTVPYHYNFILCLLGSIGLFYGFAGIRMKEGKTADVLRWMGGLCFGVYLLHEHIDIREKWYPWMHGWLGFAGNGLAGFVLELIVCTLLLFAAGIFVDWIRSLLFALAGKGLEGTGLCRKVRELEEVFRED